MGYYSVITIETKIRLEKLDEFKKAKEKYTSAGCRSDGYYDYLCAQLEKLSVHEDGEIVVDEAEGKWYEHRQLAVFLAPFVKKGDICFDGEDNVSWGYRFDGSGGFVEIVSKVEWVVKS